MQELQWLDGYSGQTLDELIRLEGECRIDSLVLAFEQAMVKKATRVGHDKLRCRFRRLLPRGIGAVAS